MASTMMFGRSMMSGMMGGPSAMGMGAMTEMPTMMPQAAMMIPRCQMTFEKQANGMKINCVCEDEMSTATLQNLCRMMGTGMCSLCCTMNGMMVSQCNMAMAKTECKNTSDGVSIMCSSGDDSHVKMIQACCDMMSTCMKAGCMGWVAFNMMPVCCGTSA